MLNTSGLPSVFTCTFYSHLAVTELGGRYAMFLALG